MTEPFALPPRSGSVAEVVETVPAPAVEPEPEESPRMAAVVDALARAVDAMGTDDDREPADFAATVETILNPVELSMLRLATTDGLGSFQVNISSTALTLSNFTAIPEPAAMWTPVLVGLVTALELVRRRRKKG